jgi:5-methylcytosine-specific restriction enzyme A
MTQILDDKAAHNARSGSRWRRRSQRFLQHHPLCEWCKRGGRITASEVSHHVEPWRNDRTALHMGELVALCKQCHDRDAQYAEHADARGFSRAVGADGWPIDPRHPVNQASKGE